MKDSKASSSLPAAWIVLAVNIAAWLAFLLYSANSRHLHRAIYEKLGITLVPDSTELVMGLADDAYAVLLSAVPFLLVVFQLTPMPPGVKLALNVGALVLLLLIAGFFVLAIRMPLNPIY